MNDQRTDGVWRRGRESNRKRGTNEKEPVQTMWRGGGVGGRMGRRPLDRPTCTALNVTIKTGMKTGRSVTSYKGTKHTGGGKKAQAACVKATEDGIFVTATCTMSHILTRT